VKRYRLGKFVNYAYDGGGEHWEQSRIRGIEAERWRIKHGLGMRGWERKEIKTKQNNVQGRPVGNKSSI